MKEKYLKVILVLLKWSNNTDEFDGYWHGYETLEDETDIQIEELKKIVKELRNVGIVHHTTCVTDEGVPCGSGNFIKKLFLEESPERLYEIYKESVK